MSIWKHPLQYVLVKERVNRITTVVWHPRACKGGKGGRSCISVCVCVTVYVFLAERLRVGLLYSSSGMHWFSSPACGCGKCQPLIELIKPFWVSDINMVSSTKGHCVRQLPLGGLLGMKGLPVLCVCVYICIPLCMWSLTLRQPFCMVKANDRHATTEWNVFFHCEFGQKLVRIKEERVEMESVREK